MGPATTPITAILCLHVAAGAGPPLTGGRPPSKRSKAATFAGLRKDPRIARLLDDDDTLPTDDAIWTCVAPSIPLFTCIADNAPDDDNFDDYYYGDDAYSYYDYSPNDGDDYFNDAYAYAYYSYDDDWDRAAACAALAAGEPCLDVVSDQELLDDDVVVGGACDRELDDFLSCYFGAVCSAPVDCGGGGATDDGTSAGDDDDATAPTPPNGPNGGSKKKDDSGDESGAMVAVIVICVLVAVLGAAGGAAYYLGYVRFVPPSHLPSRARGVELMVPQSVPRTEPHAPLAKEDEAYGVA